MYDVNQYLGIWLNDGQGNLVPNDTMHTDFYFGHYAPNTSIALCDADGDGHKELFVGRNGGEIKYYTYTMSTGTSLVQSFTGKPFFSPNPATDIIIFDQPVNEIQIYNLNGQQVYCTQQNISSLNINNLNRGIYIIKAKTINGKTLLSKLVKL